MLTRYYHAGLHQTPMNACYDDAIRKGKLPVPRPLRLVLLVVAAVIGLYVIFAVLVLLLHAVHAF